MMQHATRNLLRTGTLAVLVPLLVFPSSPPDALHIVSSAELQQELSNAARARLQNEAAVTRVLASPQAQKALSGAGINRTQVKAALSGLSDQELTKLAARAEKAEADFAAGRLTERDLLIVLLGIAALILIIVAVR